MRSLHENRQRAVQDVCNRNGVTRNKSEIKPAMFKQIYVDDKHKFLYCEIPKVACTNFKRMLLLLSGQVNASSPSELEARAVHSYLGDKLQTLDRFSIKEIKQRLHTYYKFVFVRDPLERILSAFINKFTLKYNFYFHKRYGTRIIKRFRNNASPNSLIGGHDVTFQEFVQYLLDPSASEPLNEHWRHYYKLCSPCVVQYDAIGKYETMAQDIEFVLEEIGVRHLIKFPSGTAGKTRGRTTGMLSKYYQNISSEQIHQLWEKYSVDYSMFRYPYPDVKTDATQ